MPKTSCSEDCTCEECNKKIHVVPCDTKFNRSVLIEENLRVKQTLTVDENLDIVGSANIEENLVVKKTTQLKDLLAQGNTELQGTLLVEDKAKFNDDVHMEESLKACGALYYSIKTLPDCFNPCERYTIEDDDYTLLIKSKMSIYLPNLQKPKKNHKKKSSTKVETTTSTDSHHKKKCGRVLQIKNISDKDCVKVDGEFIDGTQKLLAPGSVLHLQEDGCTWHTF